ncbi:MAG: hypothetical protein HN578_15105 [Rhodospirillales bacterium]|jgi:hypothetical protein|nr:hypothetical protein [Rhodospirillales bacterium]
MTTKHKDCYGTMFHDTQHFETNQPMKGKVFGFEIRSRGLVRSDRVNADTHNIWNNRRAMPLPNVRT